jgi:DNA-binding transcriptional LysR family regulator
MNLHHLAVFHAVAETGSVAAAAESLHISQPAVSRQVRELEQAVASELFDRLPRGMRATRAGERLADYARRIFVLERQAETALQELRDLHAGELAVGASTTIGNYLMPAVLARDARPQPGGRGSREVGNTPEIQPRVLDGHLDVGLTEGLADADGLAARVFMSDQLVVVAAPDFVPAQDRRHRLEELAGLPWVTREPGSGTRAVLEQALAAHDLQPRAAMSLASTEAIKRAVAAGAGIAVVSALTVESELARGDLVQLPVDGFPPRRRLHLLQQRHRQASRAVAAFVDLLEGLAPEAAQRGEKTDSRARE